MNNFFPHSNGMYKIQCVNGVLLCHQQYNGLQRNENGCRVSTLFYSISFSLLVFIFHCYPRNIVRWKQHAYGYTYTFIDRELANGIYHIKQKNDEIFSSYWIRILFWCVVVSVVVIVMWRKRRLLLLFHWKIWIIYKTDWCKCTYTNTYTLSLSRCDTRRFHYPDEKAKISTKGRASERNPITK